MAKISKPKKAQLGLLARAAGRAAERGSIRAAERTASRVEAASAARAADQAGYAATRKIDRFDRGMVRAKPDKKTYAAADAYSKKPSSEELMKKNLPDFPKQKPSTEADREAFLEKKKTPIDRKREAIKDSRLFSERTIKAPSTDRQHRPSRGPVRLNELDKKRSGGKITKKAAPKKIVKRVVTKTVKRKR